MNAAFGDLRYLQFRSRVRDSLYRHVGMRIREFSDARGIPRDVWRALGKDGLLAIAHGAPQGYFIEQPYRLIGFLEELGALGCAGLRAAIAVHACMAPFYLARYGSDRQRVDYLVPALSGEKIAALAITERAAGANLQGLSGRAFVTADGFRLEAEKTAITNAESADFFVVAARIVDPLIDLRGKSYQLALFVVDADSAGVTRRPDVMLGWAAAGVGVVQFDGVRLSPDALIGSGEDGIFQLMAGLQAERLAAAALAHGATQRCLEHTVEYVDRRHVSGGALANKQAIRHRLADLFVEHEAVRHLIYHAAAAFDRNPEDFQSVCMAKLKATEVHCQVASECLQMTGSEGFRQGSAVGEIFKDSRGGTMAAGPSEVMRDVIADEIFRASRLQRRATHEP
jgi:acyl-CoA dehydrogenase